MEMPSWAKKFLNFCNAGQGVHWFWQNILQSAWQYVLPMVAGGAGMTAVAWAFQDSWILPILIGLVSAGLLGLYLKIRNLTNSLIDMVEYEAKNRVAAIDGLAERISKLELPPRKSGDPLIIKHKCPITVQFNPDLDDYFKQKKSPGHDGTSHSRRVYICKVVNESNKILNNLSCEIDRIIDIKNRPSDNEMNPTHLNEKFHFEAPELPTRINLPPSPDWQKLWLFARPIDKQGKRIEIVHTTSGFYDRGRQKDVYIKFLSDGYKPKFYCVTVWVHEGLLRMSHFHEVDS